MFFSIEMPNRTPTLLPTLVHLPTRSGCPDFSTTKKRNLTLLLLVKGSSVATELVKVSFDAAGFFLHLFLYLQNIPEYHFTSCLRIYSFLLKVSFSWKGLPWLLPMCNLFFTCPFPFLYLMQIYIYRCLEFFITLNYAHILNHVLLNFSPA